MINIPLFFFLIPYNGKVTPSGDISSNTLTEGANCQVFTYSFLQHFGINIKPTFRSKELWEDEEYTRQVTTPQTFDIVFFNKTKDPYGAHIGVYLSDNKIIHLSKIVGFPTIWDLKEFKNHQQYSIYLGAKRIKS
jgi:cell wall-associated NlpC family hydrolase